MRERIRFCAVLFITAVTMFPATRTAGRESLKSSEAAYAAKGARVYKQQCEICHYSASTDKKIGPGLKGLMKREKISNGMKADDQSLRRVIELGGKNMPGFHHSLTDQQIRELIAYVKTL